MSDNSAADEGCPVEYFDFKKNLPKPVLERINAVKNVTQQITDVEQKFHEELHALEVKYNAIYRPLHHKIQGIVSGECQPKDGEKVWKPDEKLAEKEKTNDDDDDEHVGDGIYLTKKDAATWKALDEKSQGIPFFWLQVLKNCSVVAESIQENDEPLLEKLTNIDLELSSDPMGFSLHFHFSENKYITDKILTKHYIVENKVDLESPLHYEGSEIKSCIGCKINWKDGMDLTKGGDAGSFFNFFSPPVMNEDDNERDVEVDIRFAYDFEVATMLRESVVPRAILYFTGDAEDDDDDFEDEGDIMEPGMDEE